MRSTAKRILVVMWMLCALCVTLCACGVQPITDACSAKVENETAQAETPRASTVSTESAAKEDYSVERAPGTLQTVNAAEPDNDATVDTGAADVSEQAGIASAPQEADPTKEPYTICTEIAESTVRETIPSVTVHAKTGFTQQELAEDVAQFSVTVDAQEPQVEQELVIPVVPEPARQESLPADLNAVIAAANAYAASVYGCVIDPTLDMGNSSYRYPAYASANADQATVEAKDIVDYTFCQLMQQNGVNMERLIEAGGRCNVYAYRDGDAIFLYCLFA